MANLPPFDWQHVPHYAAMFVAGAALFALELWSERRDDRRKAALVRPKLASQHCKRCGGPLGHWDGRFLHGDAHFRDGGYVPRVRVHCASCKAEHVFYVWWEHRRPAPGSFGGLDCRLYNRDVLFAGLFFEGGDA